MRASCADAVSTCGLALPPLLRGEHPIFGFQPQKNVSRIYQYEFKIGIQILSGTIKDSKTLVITDL